MDLLENFNLASKKLNDAVITKSRNNSHEVAYNRAYVKLVEAGQAIKLKNKYNY